MMAYIRNLLNILKQSYMKMIECPLRTFMIISVDLLTFLASVLVAGAFQNRMMEHLMAINSIVSSRLSGIGDASVGKVSEALGMISVDAFTEHYNAFLLLLFLMFLCTTAIYILFQHRNWMKSIRHVTGENSVWKNYLARFAVIAALWVGVFVAAMYGYIKMTLSSMMFTGVGAYGNATKWFIISVFLLGFYFSFIGYSIAHKHTLPRLLWTHIAVGIKKAHYIMPLFMLFMIKSYLIYRLMGHLFPVSTHIMVPMTVMLIMPWITVLRFGCITANGEYRPKKTRTTIIVKKITKKKDKIMKRLKKSRSKR